MQIEPNQEVRFAVVLYGGVSLAIYMNGISQELLSMVRGSSDLDEAELTQVEKVYRRLSMSMPDNPGGQTRLVVDIISGTSAGGINGVALAKALVTGSRDLKVLRRAWTEDADIGALLDDRKDRPRGDYRAQSLLDGRHMYRLLLKTLTEMNPPGDPSSKSREPMDLFVTATDLGGQSSPILLTGAKLDENIHKEVFHFAYDPVSAGSNTRERNDFTPENDAMLAFAARCTSSFPVAFPPVSYADLTPEQQEQMKSSTALPKVEETLKNRMFADGGYLDNRPFSHAIDLIPFRPTTLPGQRKLLFVDPFPEKPKDPKAPKTPEAPPEVHFLQNAKLGAMTLPRRETIREDLHAITRMNSRLERLATLQKRWEKDLAMKSSMDVKVKNPVKPDNIDTLFLTEFLGEKYSDTYPLYHHLRVYGATDTLSLKVGALAGYRPDSDETRYLRLILRAWRDAHYSAYFAEGKRSEMAFLTRYDIDFRLRRLVRLRARTDELSKTATPEQAVKLRAFRKVMESELAKLRRLRSPRIASAAALLKPEAIASLESLLKSSFDAVMVQTRPEERQKAAEAVYSNDALKDLVDLAMEAIGAELRSAFDVSSAVLKDALKETALAELEETYTDFHWHDFVTLPFLEGNDLTEYSEVQVFRISPADSELRPDPGKLAGIAVGAFGGFLSKDWRQHDILWGRLDGAERIVAALLPRAEDEKLRREITRQLQDAILRDEFDAEHRHDRYLALMRAKLAKRPGTEEEDARLARQALGVSPPPPMDFDAFKSNFIEDKPLGPPPTEIADWGSRSAEIFSQMIRQLPTKGAFGIANERLAGGLRLGGALSAKLVRFALPGTFNRRMADGVLLLLLVVGIVMTVLGVITATSTISVVGALLCLGVIAFWIVLNSVGETLKGRRAISACLTDLGIVIALALMLIGAWTSFSYLQSLWSNR